MIGKLPRFRAGEPLAQQLTSERLNGLVDYVQAITPRPSKDISINITPAGAVPTLNRKTGSVGMYDNPYAAGTLGDGASGTPDGNGVYGGSTDTPETNPENPHTDTWDREKKINDISNVRTYGYTGPFIRVESYTETPDPADSVRIGVWIRTPIFDSRGCLVSVGPEVQELGLLVATPPP